MIVFALTNLVLRTVTRGLEMNAKHRVVSFLNSLSIPLILLLPISYLVSIIFKLCKQSLN